MAASITKPRNADFFLFAYDINLFKVTGGVPGEGVDFNVGGYLEHRTADANGYAECNVSSYLQALFTDTKGNNEFATTKQISISVETDGGITDAGDYFVVYGASAPGEHLYANNTTERVHYWPEFGVQNLYALRSFNSNFAATLNGQVIEGSEVTPTNKGVVSISLSSILANGGDAIQETWVRPGSPARIKKVREIVAHDETDGLFLRWLDRHGCFQYWLFTIGNEERAGAQYGSEFPIVYDEGGNQYTATRAQGHTYTRKIDVCAALIERDDYELLCDLIPSANVCAYLPGEGIWQPVQVAAGKAAWARDKHEKMQDFSATIIFPDYNVQAL